jgi:hypothetical protein
MLTYKILIIRCASSEHEAIIATSRTSYKLNKFNLRIRKTNAKSIAKISKKKSQNKQE